MKLIPQHSHNCPSLSCSGKNAVKNLCIWIVIRISTEIERYNEKALRDANTARWL